MTGNYIFWIASDDNSELYLSTNDNPANKVSIASVPEWTASRQWNKFPSQKSALPINLTAGQRYYVEVLQKEGDGGDNLAVGWAMPGEATSAPSEVIPGSVLSPFSGGTVAGPEINVLGNGTTITDGDTTPSGSDHTDFGSTDVTSGTVTRTFTIQNLGTASLTVGSVSSSNAAEFSVIMQPPASPVAAGGNTSFQVRFDPSAVGTRSATVSFSNNDADENPYNFALQGTGGTAGSGSITREVWTGITGNTVANIPVGTTPNLTDTLPSFEAPTNWADNYGTRLRGYITAPVTGNYIFWIASDDNSELCLSTSDDNPANKVSIASVPEWTASRQWNKFPSQKSALPINLTAGQRYYVEVLQKEGDGGDNLAVGWAKPGEATSAPSEVIPGSVLSPFSGGTVAGPEINVLGNGTTITDGDTTPSGSDHTDFGSADVTSGTVTRTFTIQNLGTASLTVGSVSSSNAAEFSVIMQPPASPVAAGENTSFQVRFDPSAVGTRSATVSFSNNDAGENPYNFALQGTGGTAGSGSITREVWTGITGNTVANIPVGTTPNLTDTLPSFEAPTNWADNYGTRLRGYITAPVTGNYIFWIASDDNSELYLSTSDDSPANKVSIASVPEWTASRQWNKFPSQKSALPINLTADTRYYVEVLQKEGDGGDNLAVGWAKPGEATSAPSEVIPGSVLSPFSGGSP